MSENVLKSEQVIEKAGLAIKILMVILILITITCSLILFEVEIGYLITLILFFILYVQVPGCVIFSLLNTVKIKNMARFAIQFFIGFAAITFIYYFSVLLDAAWILSLYSGAMLLVFIVRIAKKERKRSAQEYVQGVLKKFYNADPLLFVSMAAIFITSFICTQGTYPSFDYAEYVYLYPDNVWHMGIANSAAQGFPIEKPWYFSDSPLNYHYFCDLLYGIAQRALNIPADVAILSGTPYLITFLYTTSAYGCIKELTSGRKYLTGIFPVLSIFGVFLYTLSNYSNYFFHVLKNVNSVGVAVSLLMCIIIVIKYALKERDKKKFAIFLIIIMAMTYVLTGLKSPFALVMVVGFAGTFLFSLFFKTAHANRGSFFCIAILAFAAFAITYVLFIMSDGGSRISNTEFISWTVVLKNFASINTLCIMGTFALPFIVFFVSEARMLISKRSAFDFTIICIFAISIAGIFGSLMVNMDNGNQGYFVYCSAICIALNGAVYIDRIADKKKIMYVFVKAIFIILIFVAVANFIYFAYSNLAKAYNGLTVSKPAAYENAGYFSKYEYEAMLWLRDNTEQDALIASDRQSVYTGEQFDIFDDAQTKWFYYSGYSQRKFFLEGVSYSAPDLDTLETLYRDNEMLYDPKKDSKEIAVKYGIDYIIVSKRINPDLDLEDAGYVKKFANRDIDIYIVK